MGIPATRIDDSDPNPPGLAFFKQHVADGCTKGTLERVWKCESCGQRWWKFRRIER